MQTEMDPLGEFGDVIIVDPAFLPLFLYWGVIPVPVLGHPRECNPADLVLCSTIDSQLIVKTRSLQKITRAILADSDSRLNFPFEISINLNLFLLDRGSHSGQNE
jgi:hypothetical protein